jgi:DNA/RNA endonuclease YhcR with UshA esterase domain
MTRGIIKNLVINDRGVFIRFEPSLYAPSIVIKRGDYEKMKTYLENKLKLGQKIRVEGKLEYYRSKPSIFVTDISQIRFED